MNASNASSSAQRILSRPRLTVAVVWLLLAAACATTGLGRGPRHGWWDGLGPVIPHDSFPSDCSLCHVGAGWNELHDEFSFDHLAETGVALEGAHDRAACLRCHNDSGPVAAFAVKGCAGCHEDLHRGQLGPDCTSCHKQTSWRPVGQVQLHARTRFPLVGAHASTSCRRCHEAGEVGVFLPVDTSCVSCHQADLARALNPPHLALGFVNRCDRCHRPTSWNEAETP